MQKNNQNAKAEIKAAMYSLASQMSIEKINVSMVIRECGISRTLFYYYYQDMFDLLEDVLSTDMDKIIQGCIAIEDPYASVEYFVLCCSGHFPMLRKTLGTKYYETAERMITTINSKYLRIVYEDKARDIPAKPDDVTFMIRFLSAGITALFFEECTNAKFSVEETSRKLYHIICTSTGMQEN